MPRGQDNKPKEVPTKEGDICNDCGYEFSKGEVATHYPKNDTVYCVDAHAKQPPPGSMEAIQRRTNALLWDIRDLLKPEPETRR